MIYIKFNRKNKYGWDLLKFKTDDYSLPIYTLLGVKIYKTIYSYLYNVWWYAHTAYLKPPFYFSTLKASQNKTHWKVDIIMPRRINVRNTFNSSLPTSRACLVHWASHNVRVCMSIIYMYVYIYPSTQLPMHLLHHHSHSISIQHTVYCLRDIFQ